MVESDGRSEMTDMLRTHYSGLTLHRKCPQAWYYKYEMRLEKPEAELAPARDFGTLWHAVMAVESLERGRAAGSLKYLPRQIGTIDGGPTFDPKSVTLDEVFDALDEWWLRLPFDAQDEWTGHIGQDIPNRLRYMLARWREQYAREIEDEQPLAVEMYWERELPGTESPKVVLFGFIDEVFYSKKRMVVVRDHKTAGSLGTQSTLDDMMDSQLQLYAWGATPAIKEWGLGGVRAISYDRMASIAPKTPVLTQAGSLSKQVTRFDLTTYVEWAKGPDGEGVPFPGRKKDGSGAGRYQAEPAVIERLSTPSEKSSWMQRTLTPLNVNLIRTHLRSAIDSAEDIGRTMQRTAKIGEAQRNLASYACRYCDFAAICRAQMVGGPEGDYEPADYGLVIREK